MVITFLKKHFKEISVVLVLLYVLNKFRVVNSSDAPLPGTTLKDDLITTGATIDNLKSQSLANILYEATANHTQFGFPATDEKAIYYVLSQLYNQADFNKVYKDFGLRKYSKDFGTASGVVTKEFDLIEILKYELNQNEIKYIRENYPHLSIF